MIYRELAVKLILCIIISLRWQLCLAQKCKALRGATSIGIYQCQGLQTLSEVEEELTPSWRGFVVLNRKEEFFDLTGEYFIRIDACIRICARSNNALSLSSTIGRTTRATTNEVDANH